MTSKPHCTYCGDVGWRGDPQHHTEVCPWCIEPNVMHRLWLKVSKAWLKSIDDLVGFVDEMETK